jgi:hypothetical protein
MEGVAFAVQGDGVGFATESYAASALYTTLASLSCPLSRIRRDSSTLGQAGDNPPLRLYPSWKSNLKEPWTIGRSPTAAIGPMRRSRNVCSNAALGLFQTHASQQLCLFQSSPRPKRATRRDIELLRRALQRLRWRLSEQRAIGDRKATELPKPLIGDNASDR